MRLGAAALATLCLVLGLVPMLVLPAIERAAASAGRVSATSATGGWISLHLLGLRGVLAPSLLAGGLAIAVLVVIVIRRLTHRRSHAWPAVNPVEPWGRVESCRRRACSTRRPRSPNRCSESSTTSSVLARPRRQSLR